MEKAQQSPEENRVVVPRLVILAPFLFVGSYLFALLQGAVWEHALLVASVALGMCLGAALLHRFRGSKSADDLWWLDILLRILVRR
jgi:hypothetical protein